MKLPGFPTEEAAQGFNNVVEMIERRSGRSRYEVVALLTLFAEAIVDEVSGGNIVRVPALGIFAAQKDERRSVVGKFGGPMMTPRFSANRAFRAQVRLTAPMSSKGKLALHRHSRNHTSKVGSGTVRARAFSTAEAIRASIRKQLGGLDPFKDLAE